MSVTIRLARVGRKNLPAYKIVVSNTRDKRNGRFLDILGHYNPSMNPESFSIDKEKYEDWRKKGALVTNAVEKLIDGKYEFKSYEPKKAEKKEETDNQTPETKDEKVETPEEKKEENPKEDTNPEEKNQEPTKEDKKE